MTPVAEIMTRDLHTVEIDTSLQKVADLFKKTGVRHIPVVNNGSLMGIVSQTDMLRLSFGSNFGSDESEADEAIYEMLSLEQVMINNVITVNADQSVRSTAELLLDREFHALPVLIEDKLVGIVTTTDIIRYLLAN